MDVLEFAFVGGDGTENWQMMVSGVAKYLRAGTDD